MKYEGRMDPECLSLCDAINRIDGVRTLESCCGHGKRSFKVWLKVDEGRLNQLALLCYHLRPGATPFQRWSCQALSDGTASEVYFMLESPSMGDDAYQQAYYIADLVNKLVEKRH